MRLSPPGITVTVRTAYSPASMAGLSRFERLLTAEGEIARVAIADFALASDFVDQDGGGLLGELANKGAGYVFQDTS